MKLLGSLRGLALILVTGIGLLLAARPVRAQEAGYSELERDWSVRVGMYVYQSKTVRSKNGEVGISGIVERTVYRGNRYDVNVGIGYNGYDHVYSVPVQIIGLLHWGRIRYGAGAGYSFGKRLDGRGTNGPVLSLLLGYQINTGKNPLSLDARYYFISGSDNELDGLSVTIGERF